MSNPHSDDPYPTTAAQSYWYEAGERAAAKRASAAMSQPEDRTHRLRSTAARWLSDNGVFSPQREATLVILLESVQRKASGG